jgi:Ca-activated chloride channel family protein
MLHLSSPHFLWLLLFVAAVFLWRFKEVRSGHIRSGGLALMPPVPESLTVKTAKMLFLLKIAGLIFLIIALSRPQWGERKVNITTEGVNIVLALDLSESMRALDFKKDDRMVTRLEAVKQVVSDFILKREGDRIGMVVFGTNAFTQLPLTRDYQTISFILDKLEIGAAGPSTAIGDAVGISLKRLEDIESRNNVIILLTDGKSNSGELSPAEAALIAAERGVKIYTVAVGTKGQAPFLVDGLFGQRYVYRKVDVDLDTLADMAAKTGGSFFKADDIEGLEQIYQMIDRLEKTKVDVEKWVDYRELYPPIAAAGMGLYFLYLLLTNTRFLRIP